MGESSAHHAGSSLERCRVLRLACHEGLKQTGPAAHIRVPAATAQVSGMSCACNWLYASTSLTKLLTAATPELSG